MLTVECSEAGGPAKESRDKSNHAILPLRGKIINSEKNRIDKLLSNAEIQLLVQVIGTGIGEEFDIAKLRYHRIIVMTDADVDGAHIRTLVVTFLYRHMPELFERGHVYIAVPPLYLARLGNQHSYLEKDSQLEELLVRERFGDLEIEARDGTAVKLTESRYRRFTRTLTEYALTFEALRECALELAKSGIQITRFKGLSEMNAPELWKTTMDPARRMVIRVAVDDAAAADLWFSRLMGDEVEPRRLFIEQNALEVKNLDV